MIKPKNLRYFILSKASTLQLSHCTMAITKLMSHNMRFPTMWYVGQAKAQISLHIRAQTDQCICLPLEYSIILRLPTEHHMEFLSFYGGCTCSSEFTLVKMPHCWKSHVISQMKKLSPTFWFSVSLSLELQSSP